jgi:drug/metabolite transporter (DMT)-like permease
MKTLQNIASSEEEQKYTCKGTIIGVFLAILCNCLYLTSSIIVKEYNLLASEICFIRGTLQMSIFVMVYIISNCYEKYFKLEKDSEIKEENRLSQKFATRLDWKLSITICLCGLSFGIMTLLAYIGIKLLPLSDFVVFGRTAPVFTLILSALILR